MQVMQMSKYDVYIKNKQPVPGIYNVKQYSSAADVFFFYIPQTDILTDPNGISARIKLNNRTSDATVIVSDGWIIVEWSPMAEDTATAGTFELQVELTKDTYAWESYKATFAVSESVAPVPPTPSGDELRGVLRVSGRIDSGIRGQASEIDL